MIDFNKLKSVDIEKLYIFNELCREGSIKKLMLKHNVTPRIIYYTLQVLEAAFDVKLYIKGKRDIILTDEGEKLYNLSMIFLESLKSISDTKNEDYEGKLTIHSTVGFAHYHLTGVIGKFRDIYPKINVRSLGGPEYLTTKYLDFDVMIGADPINRSELTKVFLRTDQYSFFASNNYIKNHPVSKEYKNCHNHDLLCYMGTHLLEPTFLKKNKIIFESNLYSSLVQMCVNGYGIASITNQNIEEHAPDNDLVKLFDGYISESENIYFSYKTYSTLREPIMDLYNILKTIA